MAKAPPPAIAPGRWLHHYRILTDLDRERMTAAQALDEVRRQISTARHHAKVDGCDLGALTMLNALTRLGEDEATERLQHLRHYIGWAALPLGTQGSLFSAPNADDIQTHDDWLAEQQGRDAAEAGHGADKNPHDPDSPRGARWYAGWRGVIDPSTRPRLTIDIPPRRSPGRPRGSRNKPKAAVVARRLKDAEVRLEV